MVGSTKTYVQYHILSIAFTVGMHIEMKCLVQVLALMKVNMAASNAL
jgi:hypothetical protein